MKKYTWYIITVNIPKNVKYIQNSRLANGQHLLHWQFMKFVLNSQYGDLRI